MIRGMYPNDKDNLFSDDDDNIKVNVINSAVSRHPPSGKTRTNGGVCPLRISSTTNAVINVKPQVATLRDF